MNEKAREEARITAEDLAYKASFDIHAGIGLQRADLMKRGAAHIRLALQALAAREKLLARCVETLGFSAAERALANEIEKALVK